VRERIGAAAERAGRDPGDVTLVAVSKAHPVPLIREAIAAGQRDFGENRVQEAVAKYKELGTQVRWHFVGRLQRNKVRHLVGWVDLIHSLDRPELAAEIGNRMAATGSTQEVLAEVNVSRDPGRGGVMPEDLASLLKSVGMSQDYEVAIEEGATLVRVGEAIFGHRSGRVRAVERVVGDGDSASNVRGR
jgi:pyridoxal phosphate enzyme (YggS family)